MPNQTNCLPKKNNCWPYYDADNIMVSHFHMLMTFMARLSRLSNETMSDLGNSNPGMLARKGAEIHKDLTSWWSSCPPQLRDQGTDWRREIRPQKLSVSETLEQEAFSSTKSCMLGCIIYLSHIMDPLGREPQKQEVSNAIYEILEIAKETPEGYGLEMGLYFGLFMAGVAIFNDEQSEDLIRKKLKADQSISIYVSTLYISPIVEIHLGNSNLEGLHPYHISKCATSTATLRLPIFNFITIPLTFTSTCPLYTALSTNHA